MCAPPDRVHCLLTVSLSCLVIDHLPGALPSGMQFAGSSEPIRLQIVSSARTTRRTDRSGRGVGLADAWERALPPFAASSKTKRMRRCLARITVPPAADGAPANGVAARLDLHGHRDGARSRASTSLTRPAFAVASRLGSSPATWPSRSPHRRMWRKRVSNSATGPVPILPRAAGHEEGRPRIHGGDTAPHGGGFELGAALGPYEPRHATLSHRFGQHLDDGGQAAAKLGLSRERPAGGLVGHSLHPGAAAVIRPVADEVVGPDMLFTARST